MKVHTNFHAAPNLLEEEILAAFSIPRLLGGIVQKELFFKKYSNLYEIQFTEMDIYTKKRTVIIRELYTREIIRMYEDEIVFVHPSHYRACELIKKYLQNKERT